MEAEDTNGSEMIDVQEHLDMLRLGEIRCRAAICEQNAIDAESALQDYFRCAIRLAQVFYDQWPRISRMTKRMAESPEHYPGIDVQEIENRLATIRILCVNSLRVIAEIVFSLLGRIVC